MKETPLGVQDCCISGNNNGHAHNCTPFASREMTSGGKVAKTADRTHPFSFLGILPHPVKRRNLSVKHSRTDKEPF